MIQELCGAWRTTKLKGGGKKLDKPKKCESYIDFHLSFDGKTYVGTCNSCGIRKVKHNDGAMKS